MKRLDIDMLASETPVAEQVANRICADIRRTQGRVPDAEFRRKCEAVGRLVAQGLVTFESAIETMLVQFVLEEC